MAAIIAGYLGDRFLTSWPFESIERTDGGWTVKGAGELPSDAVVVAVPPARA